MESGSHVPQTGQEALDAAEILSVKIGGGRAACLSENFENALSRRESGKKQILVLSAIRSEEQQYDQYVHPAVQKSGDTKPGFNTTSHLIALARTLKEGRIDLCRDILKQIRKFTIAAVTSDIENDKSFDDLDRRNIPCLLGVEIDEHIKAFLRKIEAFHDEAQGSHEGTALHELGDDWVAATQDGHFSITGFGEELARAVYTEYFKLRKLDAAEIQTDVMMSDVFENKRPDVVFRKRQHESVRSMKHEIKNQLSALFEGGADTVIAGGYLPVIGGRRGYSDITGVLIAKSAQYLSDNAVVVIEKGDPILSIDPRKISGADEAAVIWKMTYGLAREVFGKDRGADGGAMHPSAVAMAARADLQTVIYNPADSERTTLIANYDPEPNSVEIVASRPVSLALLVRKDGVTDQSGFEASVRKWMAHRGAIPDQTVAGETTVTYTFSTKPLSPKDVLDLRKHVASFWPTDAPDDLVEEKRNVHAAIFCMGNNMKKSGIAKCATGAIHSVGADIHAIAQGLSERTMCFVIDEERADAAILALHREFVSQPAQSDEEPEEHPGADSSGSRDEEVAVR